MKTTKRILLCGLISLFLVTPVISQSLPIMWHFVIDGSASVSDADFKTGNAAVAQVLNNLYQRSQEIQETGYLADQIGVAWFGGNEDFDMTPFFNWSNYSDMQRLYNTCVYKTHPNYGATAIYSSIFYSMLSMAAHEQSMGVEYAKVIVIVTDGSDTDSPAEVKQAIRANFPNDAFGVIVVGVGSGARIAEFDAIGGTINIENFNLLVLVLDQLRERLEEAMR